MSATGMPRTGKDRPKPGAVGSELIASGAIGE
jgi:hypothetical protein